MNFVSPLGDALARSSWPSSPQRSSRSWPTPVVRRLVVRYGMLDRPEARRVNVVPIPRGGGIAVATAFMPSPGWSSSQPDRRCSCRSRSAVDPPEVTALLVGGAVAAALGAIDDFLDLRARYQLIGQVFLACGAVALGVSITFVSNPFGPGIIPFG